MLKEAVKLVAFDIGGTLGRVGLLQCLPAIASVDTARPASADFPGPGEQRGRRETHSFSTHSLPPFEIVPLKLEILQRDSSESGPHWLARLIECALQIAPEFPRACAVSFGGPVSPDGQILSMHVPGWEHVDLAGEIARAFHISRSAVDVENDANAGALGEYFFGSGRGSRDMLYFTVSTGVGGGVILDGKLRRGVHGFAGEFGHMLLDARAGAPQYALGKRGAFEALASGPALARIARTALEKSGANAPEILNAKEVFEAAAQAQPWACEALAEFTSHLARGIAAAQCAFDVERIVIGGGVALAGELLLDPLRKKIDEFLPTFLSGKFQLVPASLGDKAPMYGAVAACLE